MVQALSRGFEEMFEEPAFSVTNSSCVIVDINTGARQLFGIAKDRKEIVLSQLLCKDSVLMLRKQFSYLSRSTEELKPIMVEAIYSDGS